MEDVDGRPIITAACRTMLHPPDTYRRGSEAGAAAEVCVKSDID